MFKVLIIMTICTALSGWLMMPASAQSPHQAECAAMGRQAAEIVRYRDKGLSRTFALEQSFAIYKTLAEREQISRVISIIYSNTTINELQAQQAAERGCLSARGQ
jgi:hypothetical protein